MVGAIRTCMLLVSRPFTTKKVYLDCLLHIGQFIIPYLQQNQQNQHLHLLLSIPYSNPPSILLSPGTANVRRRCMSYSSSWDSAPKIRRGSLGAHLYLFGPEI